MKTSMQKLPAGGGAHMKEAAWGFGGILGTAASGLAAFVMANSFLFNTMAPFGVAFAASSKGKNFVASVAGALLGYTFSYNPTSNVKYIIALVLMAAVKWMLTDSRLMRFETVVSPVVTLLAVAAADIAIYALDGLSPYDLVLSFSEGALAGGSVFFMLRTLGLVSDRQNLLALSSSDLSCMVITFAILMMAMGSFTIGGLSLGRVAAVVVILISARYGREAAGAVAGVTAGAAMGLLGSSFTYLAAAYGFGGLVAGMFAAFGSFGIAAIFVVVNGIVSLVMGGEGMVMNTLYEVFAASVIFVLIPARWTDGLMLARRGRTAAVTRTAKEIMLGKLRFASRALTDISATTQQVSEKLLTLQEEDINSIYSRGVENACRRCECRADCWGAQFSDSMESLNRLGAALRRRGRVEAGDLTGRLGECCIRKEQLAQAVNGEYAMFAQKRGSRRRVTQIRGVVTDQFEGMSMMLGALAEELAEIYEVDDRKSRGISDVFLRHKAELACACAYEDQYGRLSVEADLPAAKAARLPMTEITAELCDLCDTTFELPKVLEMGDTVRLVFGERANLTAEYGKAQYAFGGGKLCGDCSEFFVDNRGRAHVIVSDGMGSGGKAAIDAAMTVSLLTKLLAAGFDYAAALKIVNSALLVKSDEESLSTIDLATVDLYTGGTDFLKAGAAPSFVYRGGSVAKVESMSMPAGILRGVEFDRSTMTLGAGDIIVLLSDGALLTGADWLPAQIKLSHGLPAREMAQEIADVARLRRAEGHDDDITVAVLKLGKGE